MLLTDAFIKKQLRELNAKKLAGESIEREARLSDGGGLYLLLKSNGSAYWRLRYRFQGEDRLTSFGEYKYIPLALAREKREEYKANIARGIDPRGIKDQQNALTFREVAMQWHDSNRQWSPEHSRRILKSLMDEVFPQLGERNIKSLNAQELLQPVKVIQTSGRLELASRIYQRINSIMTLAVDNGLLEFNPIAHKSGALIKKNSVHRPALELEKIPELLRRIDEYKGRELTKLTIQFLLHTFVRSSEMRFARWDEFDLENAIWTIPSIREEIPDVKFSYRGSKMKTQHIVPLSDQALKLIKRIKEFTGNRIFVFTGDHYPKKPMSENTINHALQTMGYNTKKDVCSHGFRTMACSALIESGKWSRDAIERQMSHQERNNVRAAYIHKAELIPERRKMMQWWSDYLQQIHHEFKHPYSFNTNI
ncbi:tyrosine-type recombinase/integrase [Klebsiella pneumoniae]|uniref:tyrosine-type recombinase/integrase n=1 Tax=Klebsiella pneumoniae TaxID=573 RepID=UPI000E2CDF7E|nr:tyrosine-type recombinase/integrase [Klebsiella pneumoniae]KAB7533308.1 tyrosine-type recombinase/integrase [Klebsiella pneumoniae]MEC4463714.1 tyrosine-type recombinase/integrase [Klebsiella pneumoniae]MEC4499666.1 tyrosine-type recombinase/integrase [Klebsiella pneumoniae]QZZ99441.1 tyrosine-type recombinase/integrase [Klebsiella pneumoniae]SYG64440.1 phage integrase family protein [Klebsiella pneumoniae]